MRKVIVFGNGLGMALDPKYFCLDSAIKSVWEDNYLVDEVTKKLICSCLPDDGEYPHSEEDMDRLQIALASCDFLSEIQSDNYHWLSEHGKAFPDAVRSFLYNVSIHFHNPPEYLSDDFLEPLVNFVKKTNSHVATLNYDNLIYRPFIEKNVLSGYDGTLVDGFYGSGFNTDNLIRKYDREFGYYLHLHGSPLYIDAGDRVVKYSQSDIDQGSDRLSSHIVLTHVEHKKTIIEKSKVLSTYWYFFREALRESNEVILVGYSGLDKHLNELIFSNCESKDIRVIEWSGAGNIDEREAFWREELGEHIQLTQLDNILEFNEW